MRSILALSLLIALCGVANAAPALSRHRHTRSRVELCLTRHHLANRSETGPAPLTATNLNRTSCLSGLCAWRKGAISPQRIQPVGA